MGMARTWLRLDLRRRWRSLVVLALLVALSAGVVLTAVAGARRGDTAFGRLWARTLPATVVVLPNQPGFDWAKVRALPEVSALGLFAVYYGAAVEGMDGVDLGFPPANADALQTVERPVVLAGRMASPGRADEAVVTPHFLTAHHKQVGDILTLRLSTPAQAAAGIDASQTPPAGPRVTVRIVGVIRTPFGLDNVGDSGGVIPTYALLTRYRADIMGTNTSNSPTYINGLIRLAGGEAAIPAFRADLARVTGRSDIDVLDENIWIGDPARKVTGYEAACLLAFGLAALLAALVLVGQSVARYASAAVAELLVLRAVGLTRPAGGVVRRARARAGRGRRRHDRRGRRDRRLQLDADRRRLPRGTEPGDQRRLAGARRRLGRVRAARACRDGGHRVDRLAGRAGCPRPQVPGGRGRGPGGSAGARHRRRALRARAGARPRGRPGPPGDRGGGRRRARRAGRADVLRGHLRRGPQPGAVRPDVAAGDLLRRGRPGLRPGGRGVPCRGGRPRRHRVPRRAHRRRPGRAASRSRASPTPRWTASGFPWC